MKKSKARVRRRWALNPRTRVVENRKRYSRKRSKRELLREALGA